MKTKMMSYSEAKVYLKPLGLKNKADYNAWWNANKPDFLPQFPEEYYSKKPNANGVMVFTMDSKEKAELIKNVSKLSLSGKENKLFQKVIEKGSKNWNDNDIEFLTFLYDLHYNPILSIGGVDIYPWEQTVQIQRETKARREKAAERLTEEPYALWFKNLRYYK
jgi:hypothetical protein